MYIYIKKRTVSNKNLNIFSIINYEKPLEICLIQYFNYHNFILNSNNDFV